MPTNSNPPAPDIDQMYPHSGHFTLSGLTPEYPSFKENIYLLMRGFNAVKIKGPVNNARITLVWNLDRRYGTELWIDGDGNVDDILIFPFKDNSGTITFEGLPEQMGRDWDAKLSFEFVNLNPEQIEELKNSDSS